LLVVSLAIGGLSGFSNRELSLAKSDWQQAGEINNQVLLALGSNYANFPEGSTLYFINLPTRLNRAWVFPGGLADGLWFIYRDETLKVKMTDDLDQTLKETEGQPKTYIFHYKDGGLEEIAR
jgi:hypothetical protein